jgi:hypothetical protein
MGRELWVYFLVVWAAVAVGAAPSPKKGNKPIDRNLLKNGHIKKEPTVTSKCKTDECHAIHKEIHDYSMKIHSLQKKLEAKFPDTLTNAPIIAHRPANSTGGNRAFQSPFYNLGAILNEFCLMAQFDYFLFSGVHVGQLYTAFCSI